ncbi:MAG: geranylgeranylglyceryl/heptaprenylglyceryl phosphate synthase [Candidatus Micrarchaeia archaeon]
MKIGKVEKYIHDTLEAKGAMFFSLIDPLDYKSIDHAVETAKATEKGGSDIILIGGSIGVQEEILNNTSKAIKENVSIPVIIFPGNIATITPYADAIYFMSLLNARNPYWIIQAQALASSTIKRLNIEPLPVGYIVVSPGGTVGWVGDANLVPREKPKIASALALAGEFLGNRIIITDTGSNPRLQNSGPIESDMIRTVKESITVPYIVAGGINTCDELKRVYEAGADIVQIGTAFENADDAFKLAESFSRIAKEEGAKKLKKIL